MYLTNAVVHFKALMDCLVLFISICRPTHKVRCIWMTFIHSRVTLTYTEVGADTNEGVRQANADDKEYFQLLVDEVLKADTAVVRRLSQVLED